MKSFTTANFGSIAACAALVCVSLVTGAIAFESRHLATASVAQKLIAFGVAFIPALSTFVVSYFKLFAPSSRKHDQWLWFCIGLDLTALTLQGLGIAAREIGTADGLLEVLNIGSYLAAALSALAIAIAAGTSEARLSAVDQAEGERELTRVRLATRLDVLKNDPEILRAIQDDERAKILASNDRYNQLRGVARGSAQIPPAPSAETNGNKQHANFP